ncbi:hypothetical protein [Streptomyces sp. NBC_01794]|uniref:hypothetical protein n=1 Tax=Streptomyces sp. NBC_01794 TaxID=2975942 RepID=UPI003091AF4E|nr:hypothetical protein OIE54_12055 [Streptomyces sp. NBC_01794]
MPSSYSDVQKAASREKFGIWFAWLCGGIIMLIIANATKDIHIVSAITQTLLVILGILSTIAAVTMTSRLNRKAAAARKDVLDDL